ncbi:MinD/ParA family protein [uncultured Mycobacterium sp.]|uniref:MinD/ParA family ATP-binding protein n=1 Tax=uncultured Mycobacterium sp. TaxID=171292 RepID=UPI0035CB2215
MNNRDSYRGVIHQGVPSAPASGQPGVRRSARWRPRTPKPDDAQHYRQDASAYQPQPSQAPPDASTVPAACAQAPVEQQPQLGWDTLDRLEELEKIPTRSTWQNVFSGISRLGVLPEARRKYEISLRDRVCAPVSSAFPIAVLGLKGGVGKTAVVEALGSTFAQVRDDRVIAVDLAGGDLAGRHGRRNRLCLLHLVAGAAAARYIDARTHTCRNSSGLEMLSLPDYVNSEWLMSRDEFGEAFSVLRSCYSVMLIDCGNVLTSSMMEAVLSESRALVVVTSASVDAVRKTMTTLKWLRHNGYHDLIESAVLAVNHIERGKPNRLVVKELHHLAQQFSPERVVTLPFDRHVHQGKEITLRQLSKRSRRRYLEMAAALADMFPKRGTSPA